MPCDLCNCVCDNIGAVKKLEDNYDALFHDYNHLEDAIVELRKHDTADHDERIHDLENVCAEKRLIKLEEHVETINKQKFSEFHHLKPDLNKLEAKLKVQLNNLSDLSVKINKLQSSLREFEKQRIDPRFHEIEERVKDIEYRLNHIVELPTELDIRLQDVERKVDGLGNSFIKLRKEFESKLDLDYKKWVQYFNEVHPKKTPHKCPVCNGEGVMSNVDLLSMPRPSTFPRCKTCEGKGIVWG